MTAHRRRCRQLEHLKRRRVRRLRPRQPARRSPPRRRLCAWRRQDKADGLGGRFALGGGVTRLALLLRCDGAADRARREARSGGGGGRRTRVQLSRPSTRPPRRRRRERRRRRARLLSRATPTNCHRAVRRPWSAARVFKPAAPSQRCQGTLVKHKKNKNWLATHLLGARRGRATRRAPHRRRAAAGRHAPPPTPHYGGSRSRTRFARRRAVLYLMENMPLRFFAPPAVG